MLTDFFFFFVYTVPLIYEMHDSVNDSIMQLSLCPSAQPLMFFHFWNLKTMISHWESQCEWKKLNKTSKQAVQESQSQQNSPKRWAGTAGVQ